VSRAGTPDLPGFVTVLGWLRGPAVERALARLLGHAAVRPAVIEAIVRQDTGIVDLLVEQLGADDGDVRLAAIAALGRLGDRRATLPLAAALNGERGAIVAAASALARIGDPRAFDALLPLLAHDDAAVRQAAIGALNSLGHPDMAARVSALLSSSDTRLRESAVRIAGYFGYRECVDALLDRASDPDDGVRRAAVEHLPYLEDRRAAEKLGQALDDPSARVRAAAAQALAHTAAGDAHEPLLRASGDADAWVRYYAVRSLGTQRDLDALPALVRIASSDPAMHVRIAALETIGAIDGPEAADLLFAHAGHEQPDVAAAALRALGRVCDPRAIAALRAALRSDDPAKRLAAVTGLRTCGTADGVDALAWTAAADAEASVAAAAMEALSALAGRSEADARPAVAALVATIADASRREAAASALVRLPDSRIPLVAAGLGHARPEVRCAILDVLARMRHPSASTAIRAALDDSDPSVRETAITALDQLGVRGLGRRFAQMARDDESRRVRRAAAAALGRTPDASHAGDDDGTR
jgi:HEAT repeat protein